MRYEFMTFKPGFKFLWTFDNLLIAQFCASNLKSHGEYGTVGCISINLLEDSVLGLIYLGAK